MLLQNLYQRLIWQDPFLNSLCLGKSQISNTRVVRITKSLNLYNTTPLFPSYIYTFWISKVSQLTSKFYSSYFGVSMYPGGEVLRAQTPNFFKELSNKPIDPLKKYRWIALLLLLFWREYSFWWISASYRVKLRSELPDLIIQKIGLFFI